MSRRQSDARRRPSPLRPLGRVFGYWRAERRTIRDGLISLVLSTIGAVAAGVALGTITETLHGVPGFLVLLPAANFMRGSIFGAMSSRLGTSIHTGMFETTRRRGSIIAQNIHIAAVLTLSLSLVLGLLAKGVAVVMNVESASLADLVVISMLGGIGASAVVGALSVVIALAANAYGWDLDSVAVPLITAIGDMVTIPALYLATFATGLDWVTPVGATALGIWAVVATVRGLRVDVPTIKRTIRESLPVLSLTGALALAAGVLIETRVEHFTTFPAFLVLLPPLLSDSGALAATLSSRLASKLHLGALEPKAYPHGLAFLDTTIVMLFALWVFALVAVASHFAAGAIGLASPGLGTMIRIGLLAGIGATIVLSVLAYYVAVATYRLGLDPDNLGVPMVTSTSDLTAVIALSTALVIFGLG